MRDCQLVESMLNVVASFRVSWETVATLKEVINQVILNKESYEHISSLQWVKSCNYGCFSMMIKLGSVEVHIYYEVVYFHYTAFTFRLHSLVQMF